MSNSKLIINNQKMKLIENRNSLQIKKGKLILNEDVTDISTDQAASIITDTGKSFINIGEGIIKMYLSHMKLAINVLLTPLTKNLNEVIKSYEQDINETNKLFAESIPSNVKKTSQLINLSTNSSSFVFSKVFDNLQKVEGISNVINAKNVTDVIIPPSLQGIINNFYEKGKDIPGEMWKTFTKDLPDFFKVESSTYSSLDKESSGLKQLNDDLNDLLGIRKTNNRGISGLKINTSNDFENYLLDIVNSVLTATIKSNVTAFFTDENCANLFHTLLYCDGNKSFSNYNDPGINISSYSIDTGFFKGKAEKQPAASDLIIRQKVEGEKKSGNDVYITIKKDKNLPGNHDYEEEKCFFSLDDGTDQKTEDVPFKIFF